MKSTIAFVFLLAAAFALPAAGQLATPNAAGISLGHIHLYVSDVSAQQKFWATMGGVAMANQRLEMIQFPGVFILLRRGQTKGGTAGSIVNHIGFVWKDLPAAKAKWEAAGYKIEQDKSQPRLYSWSRRHSIGILRGSVAPGARQDQSYSSLSAGRSGDGGLVFEGRRRRFGEVHECGCAGWDRLRRSPWRESCNVAE